MGKPGSLILPEDVISFKNSYIFIVGKSQTAQTPKVLSFLVVIVAVVFPNVKDEQSIRMAGNDHVA